MENYNDISSDTGQGKPDWHYIWWSTISVLTLDKIKMMAVSMQNYNFITSDTGKDKTDWHFSMVDCNYFSSDTKQDKN